VEIRIVSPEDAAEIVRMANRIDTTSLQTAHTFRALLERGAAEGTERLVAELDGAIVAWAPSGLHGDGSGWFWVGVDASHRRQGVGTALYDRIETRLARIGASALETQINDEDGRVFLEHRGFVRTNVMRLQALDLARADLPEPGLSTLPLSAIDIDSIRDLYKEGHADIPSASPRAPLTDEDFQRKVVDAELVDRDLSSIAVEDGRPIAFTIVIANHDDGRASAQMTAVARDRRGRGLAYAVKVDSLRRCRAAGLQTMVTQNDLENAPMLAVNRKLGFEATVLVETYEKELRAETSSSPAPRAPAR
jgi:GNAT superfamily N-acetyltransferase